MRRRSGWARWCNGFSAVIFLPVNLDRGHQQTDHNRPDEKSDDAAERQPTKDAEYEEEHGNLGRLSDQPGSKKLIDHHYHTDSPPQHDQPFPQRTGHEEVQHDRPPHQCSSAEGKRRKNHRHRRQYDGKRHSEDPIGQACHETLNNRGKADPFHHGTNGLIHAIDDSLLMG